MNKENGLPEGWELKTIADIGKIVTGKTPSTKEKDNFGGDIPFIKPSDLDNGGYISETAETLTNKGFSLVPNLPPKSLLVTCIGNLGKVGITTKESSTNQQINAIIPFDNVDYKFIYFQLLTLKSWLNETSSATTISIINKSKFSQAPIIIPPLPTQQKIAQKLTALLDEVEQIKKQLEQIPTLLKTFRQSVLTKAVSGELSAAWREENGVSFESWEFEKAEDICDKVQSGSTPKGKPFDKNGTIPFLKVYNIVNQKLDFDYKPQFITEEDHSKRSIVYPNDVLMNIVGPPLGKVAIVTPQYSEWNINQAITLFRANPDTLNYRFLYFVLCEGRFIKKIEHDLKGSVGQVNISLSQCRNMILPVPTISEQHHITQTIERYFTAADEIENQANAALARVNLLTQAILAKAFRGELL